MTGSSSTSDTVVQTTPQNIAYSAGLLESNAAQEAGQDAEAGIQQAIQSINTQYNAAAQSLMPTTQEGVQALDQLNQYLGLAPYNPGTAPTPVTLASEAAEITPEQIDAYINSNTSFTGASGAGGDNAGGGFIHPTYTGVGSTDPTVDAAYQSAWNTQLQAGNTTDQYPGGVVSTDNTTNQGYATGAQLFGSNSTIDADVTNYLANQNLQEALPTYNQQQQQWQYANNLYNQYTATGPLTSAQITNNITNLPGYQSQLNEGMQAINEDSAAKGLLGSGAMLQELNTFGQNSLSQFYGNTLNQLAQLATAGTSAATTLANNQESEGNALAQLQTDYGTTAGNAALASGSALAQAEILGNQQFQTIQTGSSSGGLNLGGIGSLIGALSSG